MTETLKPCAPVVMDTEEMRVYLDGLLETCILDYADRECVRLYRECSNEMCSYILQALQDQYNKLSENQQPLDKEFDAVWTANRAELYEE